MRTKLNPDSIKIRTLRIQRGWTQEQLAEIAGISLRTIQRAEAANSAAFETLRAIAAAFETDFDRLLKRESCRSANQEIQMEIGSSLSRPDPEPAQIVVKQPAVTERRSWATLMIIVSMLTVGLVIGISLTSHLNKRSGPLPSLPHFVSIAPPHTAKFSSELQPDKDLQRLASKPKIISNPVIKAAIYKQGIADADDIPMFSGAAAPAGERLNTAETASLELMQQSSSLKPPLPSRILPLPPVIQDVPIDWTAIAAIPGDSMQETQDIGAVRQAVGLAAKKTIGFVSKARASIMHAF